MSTTAQKGPHLGLVSEQSGQAAALKARVDRLGIGLEELSEKVGITREQLGKILNGKVPNSRSFGVIERIVEGFEVEHGRAPLHTTTGAGQIEIEAEGVYGIARFVVRGDAVDAEASFARLLDQLKSKYSTPGP